MARRGASPRVTECPYYSWESRPTRAVARGDYRGKGHRCLGWTKQGGRRDAYSHNCGTTARVSGWSDTGKRSARKPACCVWGGADGKGLGNQHLASGLLYLTHPAETWRYRVPRHRVMIRARRSIVRAVLGRMNHTRPAQPLQRVGRMNQAASTGAPCPRSLAGQRHQTAVCNGRRSLCCSPWLGGAPGAPGGRGHGRGPVLVDHPQNGREQAAPELPGVARDPLLRLAQQEDMGDSKEV